MPVEKELQVQSWFGGKHLTIWIDDDGDLGIQDDSGYSIIVAQDSIEDLTNWLNNLKKSKKVKNS